MAAYRLLVLSDFSEGNSAGSVSVGFLDTASGLWWRGLLRRLDAGFLLGGFNRGGLSCGGFCSGHRMVNYKKMSSRRLIDLWKDIPDLVEMLVYLKFCAV